MKKVLENLIERVAVLPKEALEELKRGAVAADDEAAALFRRLKV